MNIFEMLQNGRTQEALTLLTGHLSAKPDDMQALALYSRVMASQGNRKQAIAALHKIVALDPDSGNAWFGLAEMARAGSDYAEAERCYRRAILLLPQDVTAPYHLGLMLASLNRLTEAKTAYEIALTRNPEMSEALVNLGNLDFLAGKFDDAESHYLNALKNRPGMPEALNGLGGIAEARKNPIKAMDHFRSSIIANPGHLPSLLGFARISNLSGENIAEGVGFCQVATQLYPDNPEARSILGGLLSQQGRDREAEAVFRVAMKRSDPTAASSLASILLRRGGFKEALELLDQLLEQNPRDLALLSDLLTTELRVCRWHAMEKHLASWFSLIDSPEASIHPCLVPSFPGASRKLELQLANTFAQAMIDRCRLEAMPRPALNTGKHPLRIGYLSGDFHQHATSYLLAGILDTHSKAEFEIFGYSYGANDQGTMRQRIQDACVVFRDISGFSARQAAQSIRDDAIDILVDLKGWTGDARPEILALRPAPVQVNWLGYPGTMGHAQMVDYLIGDPVITPLTHSEDYAESLALMPYCYQPNDRTRVIGKRPTRIEAGLPEQGFVFCSFNQPYKITPAIFDIWCHLLSKVEGSVLWLLEPGDMARNNLRQEASERGISPDRLIFANKLPVTDHLGRLQLADLALDTFPVNSHTTCADALWAGVPLITLIGDTFVSRVAASLLTAADLPDLITHSPAQYHERALYLATHPRKLGSIRKKILSTRETCALFNTAAFTRDLENLYRTMWTQHLAGNRSAIAPETSC